MAESLDEVAGSHPGSSPEEWLGAPDPVQHFRALLERALQELSREVAGIRAERDGLRLELEGLRVQYERVRDRLDDRERFDATVRELHEIVDRLNVPATRPEPAPPPPLPPPVLPTAPTQEVDEVAPTRKRKQTFLRNAAVRVLAVVAALLLLAVLLISLGPKVAPYATYVVRSGSMEPTFDTGDLIVLTKVHASDVRKGDIITFKRPDKPGTLVTHRVYAVENGASGRRFVTKGDANPAPDAWHVPATGTSWKYRFRIPEVGYVFGSLSTPVARVVPLAVPALLLGLITLADIRKPKAKPA